MTEPTPAPLPVSPDTQAAPPPAAPRCHASAWRIATIASLIALSLALATAWSLTEQFKAQIEHMQNKLKHSAQIRYVAVLFDPKSTPAQLITYDPQDGFLNIQRLTDVAEGPEDSLQLWALDDADRPLSLGVLPVKRLSAQVRVTEDILKQTRHLAISVESRGGSNDREGPRLPYLTRGALIRKAV